MIRRQTRASPSQCKICGVPALYSYFGTVVCQSCKMFFKRNAEHGQSVLKCDLDGKCQIDIHSRRACAACRLEKSFASGMRVDMIRSSRTRKNTLRKRRDREKNDIDTAVTSNDSLFNQFQIVNLVRGDPALLNPHQWTLLSNLVHCYDENGGFYEARRFIIEQNSLPVKVRFKSTPVSEFLTSILNRAQSMFEKNQDFLSLTRKDRSILLKTTVMHVASLSVHVILRPAELMDHPAFYQSHEILFGDETTRFAKRLYNQVDRDSVVMKLILAILSFSTSTYSFHSNVALENLNDLHHVLRIQDTYTEILWQYLLYKYDIEQAVLRFINLLQCIFSVHQAIARAIEVRWFTDVVDNLIGVTEQSLTIN